MSERSNINQPSCSVDIVEVEECTEKSAALLYVQQSARCWELPTKNNKEMAEYLHAHHSALDITLGIENGDPKQMDRFLIRGHIKCRAYLTASLLEISPKTLEIIMNSQGGVWKVPDYPVLPHAYDRIWFDFATLNDIENRLISEPEVKLPFDAKSWSGPDDPFDLPQSLMDEEDEEFGSSSRAQDPPAPLTPLAEEIMASLEDPNNQCIVIYPIRYRPRSLIAKMFGQADPEDLKRHPDGDAPAVPSQDGMTDEEKVRFLMFFFGFHRVHSS